MSNAEREIVVETMDQAIGRRVHQLMWDRKVTARELAPHVGVDASGLGRRLRGERGWASDEIFVTAHYFGVPVGVLFGESVSPEPSPVTVQPRRSDNVTHVEFGRPQRADVDPREVVAIPARA